MSEIEANGQYLIAMKAKDNKYYLLNPAAGNEKYKYVAKVTGEMYEDETIGAKTDITITGKAEGKTSVKIGDKTYFIFVENDVEKVTLKVGDTYNIPGEIVNKTEVEQRGIVTLKAQTDMPPYKIVSELKDGTYLFGTKSHVMLNTASTAGENPKGLGMKPVNFNVDDTAKEFMWKLTKTEAGYTMQDVSSGKYVNISGQNVELKEEAQVLTVGVKDNSGFSVSKDNNYLNNWANTNDKVAAYGMDNNTWYFYTPSSGYVATAAKVGQETLVTSEGTDYVITVIEKKPEVKEYTVTATVNNDEMGTAQLNPNASKYKEGTEVTATATVKDESKYEFVNWTVDDKEVSKEVEYKFTVKGDMELKANFKEKEKPPVEETYTVTTKVNDDKMGTVTLDPAKDKYNAGEKVTATATVKDESKYEFVNWTVNGKEVSKDAEYTFTVDKDMELKASFKAKEEPQPPVTETFEVTVKANDANMGVVAIDPKKDSYAKGEEVIIIAEAKEGYEFVNWTAGGEEISKSAAYRINVDKDMELTANFKAKEEPKPPVTEDTFKLNVTVNDDKMGTVKLDPAKESYKAGDVVTATATAKDGYKFVNWTVDGKEVSDKAEYAFKVDRDVTLKANFEKVAADPKPETPKPEDPKDEDKAIQTGDNGVSPIIPLAGLAIAAGAAVTVLRKKED